MFENCPCGDTDCELYDERVYPGRVIHCRGKDYINTYPDRKAHMTETRQVKTAISNAVKSFTDAIGCFPRFIYLSARTQAAFGAQIKALGGEGLKDFLTVELDSTIPYGKFYLTGERIVRGEFGV